MSAKNVILTGFMATGKSTVGRLLAQRLRFGFVDTDRLIEEREGRSVAAIFSAEGEQTFRRLEARLARELATRRGLVIATGGRMMLDAANVSLLGQTGPVFCLVASPHEIIERLAGEEGRRPLLDVADPQARVEALLGERAGGYAAFPQIDSDGKTPHQIVGEIQMLLNKSILNINHPQGNYHVVVGSDLLGEVRQLGGIEGPLAIISDSNVGRLHAKRCGPADCMVTMPAGEENKRLATVRQIYDALLASGMDRQATVLALGGGVVGDLAGFVAATYMRGVDFVQCPTSLLAMVDASVGGKTGVDLPQGKNLIGAFKQPVGVFVDLSTLTTLPAEEFAAGMAEVIKAGLIGDRALFVRLASGSPVRRPQDDQEVQALQEMVLDAIRVKRDVVQADPFEKGRRATLNLGHTFAHAIEQVSGYAVRHGEAVAMGLVAAAHLSAALGYCSPVLQDSVEKALTRVQLPTRIPAGFAPAALYDAMRSDKKKAQGRLRFVLLRDVEDVFVAADVPQKEVFKTLEARTAA